MTPPKNWVPVDACTLPSVQQPLRLAEFDELFATSLRDVHRSDNTEHARRVLAGDRDLLARLEWLVDAEVSCCSFFSFALTRLDDAPILGSSDETMVALDINVPPARAAILDALVIRADAARQVAL